MSDEVFVSTKLVGNIRIDLGNKRIVTPDSALKISKAALMAIPGVDKMLKNGKLVIVGAEAPVEAPPAPVEPPKAPEPAQVAPAEPVEAKVEKKSKKGKAEPEATVEPEVQAEPETPAEPTADPVE